MLAKKIEKVTSSVKKIPVKKLVVSKSAHSDISDIRRLNPGPRLSDAVIFGNMIYLAGKVAHKNKGKSVTLQTKEILAAIDATLKQAGTNKSRLITANIWLANYTTAPEMNAVWDKWVSKDNAPARATVESKLLDPGYTVEIMVTAAL